MPVKVYGTGGGKNTKDATAIPSDVRAGKTFYNAEGKQTGIWTPQATDYTGDADALPENVLNGKTFYNADGKQVGTLVEKVYSDFVFDSDAVPSDVASGKVFYNAEGRQEGNLVDKGIDDIFSDGITKHDDELFLKIALPSEKTIYNGNKVKVSYSDVRNTIGLTADKIAKGNTILGIAGTAKQLKTLSFNFPSSVPWTTNTIKGVKGYTASGEWLIIKSSTLNHMKDSTDTSSTSLYCSHSISCNIDFTKIKEIKISMNGYDWIFIIDRAVIASRYDSKSVYYQLCEGNSSTYLTLYYIFFTFSSGKLSKITLASTTTANKKYDTTITIEVGE